MLLCFCTLTPFHTPSVMLLWYYGSLWMVSPGCSVLIPCLVKAIGSQFLLQRALIMAGYCHPSLPHASQTSFFLLHKPCLAFVPPCSWLLCTKEREGLTQHLSTPKCPLSDPGTTSMCDTRLPSLDCRRQRGHRAQIPTWPPKDESLRMVQVVTKSDISLLWKRPNPNKFGVEKTEA